MFILESKYDDKTIVYVGASIENCQLSGLNVICMDIVFGRYLFPRPVELTVRVSFQRNY